MDAALNGFDIGHIAIVKSALADINPMVDLNMPILQLMQNLKNTVLKTVSRQDAVPPVVAAPSAGAMLPAVVAPARVVPPQPVSIKPTMPPGID
jgi:hypothetical protein